MRPFRHQRQPWRRRLPGPAASTLAGVEQFAARHAQCAGDGVEGGGLAAPLAPISETSSPAASSRLDALHRLDGAVGDAQVAQLQDRGRHVAAPAALRHGRRGRRRSRRRSAAPGRASSAIFLPKSSTARRSHRPITSLTSCSISSTVTPSPRMVWTSSRRLGGFGGVHAGGGFVQRQQLRFGGPARARSRGGAGRQDRFFRHRVGEAFDADVAQQL